VLFINLLKEIRKVNQKNQIGKEHKL